MLELEPCHVFSSSLSPQSSQSYEAQRKKQHKAGNSRTKALQ